MKNKTAEKVRGNVFQLSSRSQAKIELILGAKKKNSLKIHLCGSSMHPFNYSYFSAVDCARNCKNASLNEKFVDKVLVTRHGELDDGRFHDPRSRKSFHYDHLRKVRTTLPSLVSLSGIEIKA